MTNRRVLFISDENLPRLIMRQILAGHDVRVPEEGTLDPAILAEAEADGAIVISSDTFFYRQLRRKPYENQGKSLRTYRNAGAVLIPATWSKAAPLLRKWLPIILTIHDILAEDDDKRVVIDIRESGEIRIDW
jgi:hypothetical protein